ncbi:MAG: Xaa-Pro peptidase family protein [Kiritimatiellia bacterium]
MISGAVNADLLLGEKESSPDMEYVLGVRVHSPVVLLKTGRTFHAVVSRLEFNRIASVKGRLRVWCSDSLRLKRGRRGGAAGWAVGLAKTLGIRSVRVDPGFPLGAAENLRKAHIAVKTAPDGLFPQRAVKTPAELAEIKTSQEAAVIAMRSAIAKIAESRPDSWGLLRSEKKILTSEGLRQKISRVLLEHDCVCEDTIAACGKQSADPHEKGRGPLYAGEPVVIDIFPRHMEHGYWGDLTRTVVRGEASPALRAMYRAVRAAQLAGLKALKAGVKCSTVHRRTRQELERRGYVTVTADEKAEGFIHGTGHGVGLEIHEHPILGPGGEQRLKKGNVVTVEPGLYYPGTGGVRIEDTVAVTSAGYRYLAPCEKTLEI